DRGETMKTLAPSLVKELVGDNPDADGMRVARDCMASVPEASYRAMMLALLGFDQRRALGNIAVPALVLSGSKDKNAPAPMMAKMATYSLQCGARSIPEDHRGDSLNDGTGQQECNYGQGRARRADLRSERVSSERRASRHHLASTRVGPECVLQPRLGL